VAEFPAIVFLDRSKVTAVSAKARRIGAADPAAWDRLAQVMRQIHL